MVEMIVMKDKKMLNYIKNFKITLCLLFISFIGYSQQLPRLIDNNDQIIIHKGYTLSYNESCEQANWVKYSVKKNDLINGNVKRKNNFKEDTLVKTGSADIYDYKSTGYDRGHLAPASVFTHDQQEMDESFLMSNISPQEPSFNRGVWKRIEEYEKLIARSKDSINVITGAVLSDTLPKIGDNGVCVPKYFYKIIYTEDYIKCFFIENKKSDEDIIEYMEDLKFIEEKTNINFFINNNE